jgi:hypothetical protein
LLQADVSIKLKDRGWPPCPSRKEEENLAPSFNISRPEKKFLYIIFLDKKVFKENISGVLFK